MTKTALELYVRLFFFPPLIYICRITFFDKQINI